MVFARRMRRWIVGLAVVGIGLIGAGAASAAVTPGWECVPTTAGQAVLSGGTGSAPSCATGTAVLAPTYVSAGVGGKPTVEFSGVNVQVVNGSGSETTINGEGNLIVGYDASPGTQTGSHNLVLGTAGQGYTGYGGSLLGGHNNTITGGYASILGGEDNAASGFASAITGGFGNIASSPFAAVNGGCSNLAGSGTPTVNSYCTNTANTGYFASVTGGVGNQAKAEESSVTGGQNNTASGGQASIAGGQFNLASDPFSFIGGGCDNLMGTGTRNTDTCSAGGEGDIGGAGIVSTTTDGTSGVISDGVNVTNGSIGFADAANTCYQNTLGGTGVEPGDFPLLTFNTPLPAGLLIVPSKVTTAGQIPLEDCNVTGSTISYSGTIGYMTFH